MWLVINTRSGKTDKFEKLDDAKSFYDETCVNLKENNCWGILIQR